MKKFLLRFLIIFFLCFLYSCSDGINESSSSSTTGSTNSGDNSKNDESEDDNSDDKQNKEKARISSEYWGTWIQMDNGDEIYIDNQNIYSVSSSSSYKSKLQEGISGYSLESDEVLRKGSKVFFRKGGKKRSFSATISGFSATGGSSARAAGTGSQGITGRRKNKQNEEDTETVSSNDGVSVDFEGGVADDPQTVDITDGDNTGEVTVTPKYDGENVGSIPVVEPGQYAFKTTYKIKNADSQGFMFGNNLGLYEITFNITNIGQETCETSIYSISWNDTSLKSTDFVRNGNFTAIAPGAAKEVTGTFLYGYFDEEYKDVTITFTITDSKYEKTWNDYVTLRFYRGWVNFKVNARNFNQSSNAKLNGFLVYPDGRSKRFTVASGNITTVSVPWSTNNYYLVFSGADSNTEMCYSFVAAEYGNLADLSGVWQISEINAYEPNNTINNSINVTNFGTPVKAYLKNGDIDYYVFNPSSLKCSKGILEFLEGKYSDSTSISTANNNGDGKINPGETIWMDIAIRNSSKFQFSDVTVKVESDSPYITFIGGTQANYGRIDAGKGKTFYDARNSSNTGYATIDNSDYNLNETYTPFKFSINSNCPVGTVIPLRFTMKEQGGYEWTHTYNINVVKNGVKLEYLDSRYSDGTSISTANNNGDGKVNPGETIWMDIAIKNSGTSLAQGVTVTMESDSPYITFIGGTQANYGRIDAGKGKTFYDARNSSNTGYATIDNSDYNLNETYTPFKFSINSNCPVGTVIPLTLKMKEQNGYEWTYTYNINVERNGVQLEYLDSRYSDGTSIPTANNNGDGKVNPGETIWMDVAIKNSGTSLALGVTVTMESASPYITFIGERTASYGQIAAGKGKTFCDESHYSSNTGYATIDNSDYALNSETYIPFKFSINSNCPVGTVIPVTLKMKDHNNYEWTYTYNINVERNGVQLEYLDSRYSDGTSISTANNNDGKINPGETIWMDIAIKNNGTSLALGVTVTMGSASPYITFIGERTASYGRIATGSGKTFHDERCGSYAGYTTPGYTLNSETYIPFKFSINSNCPVGTVIPVTLKMKDHNNYEWTGSYNITIY